MIQWKISYKYDNPSGAGPFKGRAVIVSETKPRNGDLHYGPFGRATIVTASRVNYPNTVQAV